MELENRVFLRPNQMQVNVLDKPNVVLSLGNSGRQETLRRLVRHVNLLLLIRGCHVLLAPYAAHILVPLQ